MSISAVISTISAVVSTISPVAAVMTSMISTVISTVISTISTIASVVSSMVTSVRVTIMMSMTSVVIPVAAVVVMIAGRGLQIFRLISGLGWSGCRPSLSQDVAPGWTERQDETEGDHGLDLHTTGLLDCWQRSVRRPGQL